MKLGILGTGMIVFDLMNIYEDLGIEKTYVLGTLRQKEATEQLVADHYFAGSYYDYDEMLEDADIDTVYVGLPNFLHYEFSKKAILKGKNVICEKPITSNYAELEELAALAKEHKVILVEAMTVHYMPAFQALKEDVKKLGDIKIVSLNYSQYSSRYDLFKQGTILPAFNYHMSGGALMDLNVYNTHFIVDLFGKPKAVNYMANIEKGIDTSGILTLDYGTFKVVSIGAKDCKAPLMNTIQGDVGNIIVRTPVSRMKAYELGNNQGETEEKAFEAAHAMSYEFKEFIRMIDEKDYAKADEMMEMSKIASEVMNEARRKAGIVFDADKKD